MSPCSSKIRSQEDAEFDFWVGMAESIGCTEPPVTPDYPSELTLTERVDPVLARHLLENFDSIPEFNGRSDLKGGVAKSALANLVSIMNTKGEYPVHYGQVSPFGGRMFAKGVIGFQSMLRALRHTLCRDMYDDLDMCNAHPTFLQHLCEQNGWNFPLIKRYAQDRDHFLGLLDGDRDDKKQLLLSLLNGGRLPKNVNVHTDVKSLHAELQDVHARVMRMHPDIEQYVRVDREKGFNIPGSVTNHVLCDFENRALMCVKAYLESIGCTVAALVFDGLMIHTGTPNIPAALRGCEDAIYTEMGVRVKMTCKPMDEGIAVPDLSPEPAIREPSQFEKLNEMLQRYEVKVKSLSPGFQEHLYVYTSETCLFGKSGLLHTHGHISVSIQGTVKLKCYGCKKSTYRRYLGNINSEPRPRVDWGPNVKIVEHDPSVTRVLPYDTGAHRLIGVRAGMGGGKSYQLCRLVDRIDAGELPDGVILTLTMRRSLAVELYMALNKGRDRKFSHYLQDADWLKSDRIVLSPESLWRLFQARPDIKVRYLILDEMESVCECLASETTHRYNIQTNNELIYSIIGETPDIRGHQATVIFMGADIEFDGRVAELMKRIRPKKTLVPEIAFHRYSFSNPDMGREFYLMDKTSMYTAVRADMERGYKLAVLHRTRKGCDEWGVFSNVDGRTSEIYTSRTCGKKRKADWADPETTLGTLDSLGFTPTISVGVNILTEYDRIYIDCSSHGGASAQTVFQMSGRFRNLRDKRVGVAIPGDSTPLGIWTDRYPGMVERLRNRRDALANAWAFSCVTSPAGIHWAPSNLTMLKAYALAGQENYWANFYELARLKGFPVYSKVGNPPPKEGEKRVKPEDIMADSKATVEDDYKRDVTACLRDLRVSGYCKGDIASKEELVKRGFATAAEQMDVSAYHVVKHYVFRGDEEISFDDFEFMRKNCDRIRRHAGLARITDGVERDVSDRACPDLTVSPVGVHHCRLLLSLLTGVSTTASTESIERACAVEIPSDMLCRPDVKAHLVHTQRYMSLKRAKDPGDTPKAVAVCLRAVLRLYGLTLTTATKGNKKNRRTLYSIGVEPDVSVWADLSDYHLNDTERDARAYPPDDTVIEPVVTEPAAPGLNPYERYLAKLARA